MSYFVCFAAGGRRGTGQSGCSSGFEEALQHFTLLELLGLPTAVLNKVDFILNDPGCSILLLLSVQSVFNAPELNKMPGRDLIVVIRTIAAGPLRSTRQCSEVNSTGYAGRDFKITRYAYYMRVKN